MALIVTDAHLAVITAGTAHVFTRLSLGTGHRTPDGTETALVTPFAPARENMNPPGVLDANTRAVDWIDGATGDNVTYTASEAGLWATPTGGTEYLAMYDSHATDDLFTKPAGSIISHRFLMQINSAQIANATFNVTAVPQATETVAGVVELATLTEVSAGTDTQRAVTPAGVAQEINGITTPNASTTQRGIVELATQTEVNTGTDSVRAVTPSALAGRTATDTRAGIIELATQAEVDAGTNDDKAVTPETLTDYVEGYTVAVEVHTTEASYNNRSTTDGKLHIRVE